MQSEGLQGQPLAIISTVCKILAMKIIDGFDDLKPFLNPVSLTIGNFDGVHIGHQLLLDRLNKTAREKKGQSLAITFKEHPKSVLYKQKHSSICTLAHKCKLLERAHVDNLLLLPFTSEFAEQTADVFLAKVRKKFAFSHLILGEDALFGKERHATKEHVAALAKRFNFTTEYLKLLEINNKKVSSTLIRTEIQKGNFEELKILLGRDYSIYGKFIKDKGLDIFGLILPPPGIYAVTVFCNGNQKKAIANLQNQKILSLKMHDQEDICDTYIEAVFDQYSRLKLIK